MSGRLKKIVLCSLFFVSILETKAQDPQYSMFYMVPLYINPAFAGSRHANRVMLHNRAQWTNQPGNFLPQTFFSFDTYSSKYKSGFGASVMYDSQGNNAGFVGGKVKFLKVGLTYAYELRINSNNTLRFGLQGSFLQQSIAYGALGSDFNGDGFNKNAGGSFPTVIKPDFTAGLLYFAKRFYASVAVGHLNRPNMSVFTPQDATAVLPLKLEVSLGYKIPLILNTGAAGLHSGNPIMMSLTPAITYKKQLTNDQIDLGLYWAYKWMIAGVWYRGIPFKQFQRGIQNGNPAESFQNNESIVFLLGASYMGFGIGYSYDLTVSTQGIGTGGSHELNLSYVFRIRNTKKPVKILPCPDFEYDILQRGGSGKVK